MALFEPCQSEHFNHPLRTLRACRIPRHFFEQCRHEQLTGRILINKPGPAEPFRHRMHALGADQGLLIAACRRVKKTCKNLEQGGFPASVRPQQRQTFEQFFLQTGKDPANRCRRIF